MSGIEQAESHILDGMAPLKLVRTMSGASTEDLGSPHDDGFGMFRCMSDEIMFPSVTRGHAESMDRIRTKSQCDGMVKISEYSDQASMSTSSTYDDRLDALLDSFAEVKALWKAKYNEDYDENDSEEELDDSCCIDPDGTLWVKSTGSGPEKHQDRYKARLERLNNSLIAVKGLYRQKYGESVNDGNSEDYVHDDDGTPWICIEGQGLLNQKEDYFDRLHALEDSLSDIKALYQEATGDSVDEEDFVDDDGTLWVRSEGIGFDCQQEEYIERVRRLESSLEEAKELYKQSTGQNVDDEDFCDDDGTLWVRIQAVKAEQQRRSYNRRMTALLTELDDVKANFMAQTNLSFDDDFVDEDGTLWTRTCGDGFTGLGA